MTAAIVTLASLALVLVLGNPALVLGSSVQDQGCCTGSLICDMYGAFPSKTGFSKAKIQVFASGTNYTARLPDGSGGLITRGDIQKQFLWTGDHCVATAYTQAAPPYCTGSAGFWSQLVGANQSLPGGVAANQWQPKGAAAPLTGYDINMWFTADGSCLPLAQVGGETELASWFYYNQRRAQPDASVFVPPAACDKAAVVGVAGREGARVSAADRAMAKTLATLAASLGLGLAL